MMTRRLSLFCVCCGRRKKKEKHWSKVTNGRVLKSTIRSVSHYPCWGLIFINNFNFAPHFALFLITMHSLKIWWLIQLLYESVFFTENFGNLYSQDLRCMRFNIRQIRLGIRNFRIFQVFRSISGEKHHFS